ncbi:MAG TPA: glutaredoxin 3 [Xanthomonadaceae bacterium]|nr:glutaredoxin 3 [Xanthomonadaceae bacterium]
MTKVEIYTSAACGYCGAAKRFFGERGLHPVEYRIDLDAARLAEMLERSGRRRSVPQIFINDTHVGGFDDLVRLDREGGLQPLLEGAP